MKAIDCMAQHIKTFHTRAMKKVNMLMPELMYKKECAPASATDVERTANMFSRAVQEYLSELNE